jgi:hydrogenase maturation factor
MCLSRLHLAVGPPEDGHIEVQDLDGRRHAVSLLAYDGPPLRRGDWLVVHSGFALARAERRDALAATSVWPSPGDRALPRGSEQADSRQADSRQADSKEG